MKRVSYRLLNTSILFLPGIDLFDYRRRAQMKLYERSPFASFGPSQFARLFRWFRLGLVACRPDQ